MAKKTQEKPIAKKKLIDALGHRLFSYSFLKRVFIEEPTKEFVELLINENLLEIFLAEEDNKQIKKGIETVYLYLKNPDVLSDENMNDLGADYVNLFVGPGKLPAPPYESVYLNDKRLVFQEETMQVRAEYLKENLVSEHLQQEPDDHIALELNFLGHLCHKTMTDLKAGRLSSAKENLEKQKKFMTDHLLVWAPEFADSVQKSARTDFYRGTGHILSGLLAYDMEMVDELIRQVDLWIDQKKDKKAKLKSV